MICHGVEGVGDEGWQRGEGGREEGEGKREGGGGGGGEGGGGRGGEPRPVIGWACCLRDPVSA